MSEMSAFDASAIIAQYQNGMPPEAILREHRIGTAKLYRTLREHGVSLRGRRKEQWSPEQAARAWELYQGGMNADQVGREFGVSADVARRELKANGYRLICGPKPEGVDPLTERILSLYQNGSTIRQVAHIVGRAEETVSNILKAERVQLRGRHVIDQPHSADEDAPATPPRWAVVAYRNRIAQGVAEPVARRMSNLAHYDASQIAAVMARVAEVM